MAAFDLQGVQPSPSSESLQAMTGPISSAIVQCGRQTAMLLRCAGLCPALLLQLRAPPHWDVQTRLCEFGKGYVGGWPAVAVPVCPLKSLAVSAAQPA